MSEIIIQKINKSCLEEMWNWILRKSFRKSTGLFKQLDFMGTFSVHEKLDSKKKEKKPLEAPTWVKRQLPSGMTKLHQPMSFLERFRMNILGQLVCSTTNKTMTKNKTVYNYRKELHLEDRPWVEPFRLVIH